MRVAIHQPNYFPWMGYFNKIAKSDLFVLMDKVQMTDSGTTQRNRILNKNGEISFLTIPYNKKDYLQKTIMDIEVNSCVDWQKKQYNFLWDTYHSFDSWCEVYNAISPVFEAPYKFLVEVNKKAIDIVCDILKITTPIVRMSSLKYDEKYQKNRLVVELCKSVGADTYLSGNGARKYMQLDEFYSNGIRVQFQTFTHPGYHQRLAKEEMVLGLSILDVLFNCGIEKTQELFWSNLQENEKSEFFE